VLPMYDTSAASTQVKMKKSQRCCSRPVAESLLLQA
jgi:hypothetical protein